MILKKVFFTRYSRILLAVILLGNLSACSGMFKDKFSLTKVKYEKLKGWNNDDQAEAMLAFKKSCAKYKLMPADKKIHSSGTGGVYKDWQEVCSKIDDSVDPKLFFESNFTPYAVKNRWKSKGLFTGYFESDLNGSRTKQFPYIYPVYGKPKDLIAKQQYFSRAEIEAGALDEKGLEIAWVDDKVELFFAQIQGSARIKLEDGSLMQIGYDGQNGYSYYPIGRYLFQEGYLEKKNISKATIEEWLKQNPDKAQETLEKNQSYVFFREIKGEGPIGAQGVPLTPMRSLAVDKKYIPYGAPIWLEAKLNGGANEENSAHFQKLLVAQDTGGAIKGPIRGDIFFGYGVDAEKMAGYQNNEGKYFILLPNAISEEVSDG